MARLPSTQLTSAQSAELSSVSRFLGLSFLLYNMPLTLVSLRTLFTNLNSRLLPGYLPGPVLARMPLSKSPRAADSNQILCKCKQKEACVQPALWTAQAISPCAGDPHILFT